MRHILILATALAAAWSSPSFAQSQSGDEKLLRFHLENSHLVGYCADLGFKFDNEALGEKVKTLTSALVAAGASDAYLRSIVQDSKAALASEPDVVVPELSEGREAEDFAEYEERLMVVQKRCDALKQDPRFSQYMTAAGYQATPGKKSAFGRIIYDASNGDAKQMFLLGALYDRGVKPDPDHKLEFNWYLKAAEHGHPEGAGMAATDYFVGRGVEKNVIEAFKWAVICQLSGGTSEYRDLIEPSITAAERQTGRDKALAWLRLRP